MARRQYRGRLGEYLIENGHLSSKDLERALEIQRVAGGHLGTNLLELGVVSEDELLDAIGKIHETPTASSQSLSDIPREVSAKVPRELVRRHGIVPFALHGNTVYIASQRPGDIHIENEVTLATSRLTRTFIGLEVRVQQALHRNHGHSLPLRFSRLIERLDGSAPVREDAPKNAPVVVEKTARDDSQEWISATPGNPDALGFDPTLADTVGRRIKWREFEEQGESSADGFRAEVEAESTDDSNTDGPAVASEPDQPVERPAPVASAPKPAEQLGDSKSAAQSTEGPSRQPGADQQSSNSVRQFPYAVRAKRERRSSRRLPELGAAASSDRPQPTVEIEPLEDVSSAGLAAGLLDAHAALLEASTRDGVARIVMQGLRPFFRRRLLLAKRGHQLRGWLADGPGVRPRNLATLNFPVADGTPFLAIQNGSRFWLSSYHQDKGFQALSNILGPVRAPDCMVLPLRAGRHIVGFLYGDNERQTVTGQPLQQFLELSEAAGTAFERIILRKRETHDRGGNTASASASSARPADPWATTGG